MYHLVVVKIEYSTMFYCPLTLMATNGQRWILEGDV